MMLLKKRGIAICFAVLAISCLSAASLADSAQDGPVLDGISLYSGTASPGQSVLVGVDAYDQDGIKSIVALFQKDDSKEFLVVSLKEYDDDPVVKEKYVGRLMVPSDTPEGLYHLISVAMMDENDNRSRYCRTQDRTGTRDYFYELEASLQLVVKADITAPMIESFVLENSSVLPGSRVNFSMRCDEDQSGIEKATVIFRNPVSGKKLYCFLDDEAIVESNTFAGTLHIPYSEVSGVYQLYKVTAEDKAKNKETYCIFDENDTVPLNLEVSLSIAGKTNATYALELLSVKVPSLRTYSNKLQYSTQVSVNNSQPIDHITLRFKNKANDRTLSKVLTPDDYSSGLYTAWMDVNLYEPQGAFILERVELVDSDKNRQVYCLAEDRKDDDNKRTLPQSVSFMVNSGITYIDETAPVLSQVLPGDSSIHAGETLNVTAQASDDLSGVDEVRLQFKNETGNSIMVTLTEKNSALTGTVKAFQTKKTGSYTLVRAQCVDKAGNSRTYYAAPEGNAESLTVKASFTIKDAI